MPLICRFMDWCARKAGYVPASELARVLTQKADTEAKLTLKTENLEHTIALRDQLDREVNFLRVMHLAHINKESDTQKAVSKLEAVTNNLITMMQSVWPAAITEEPTEEKPATAAE